MVLDSKLNEIEDNVINRINDRSKDVVINCMREAQSKIALELMNAGYEEAANHVMAMRIR